MKEFVVIGETIAVRIGADGARAVNSSLIRVADSISVVVGPRIEHGEGRDRANDRPGGVPGHHEMGSGKRRRRDQSGVRCGRGLSAFVVPLVGQGAGRIDRDVEDERISVPHDKPAGWFARKLGQGGIAWNLEENGVGKQAS